MAGNVTLAVGARQMPGYLALPVSEKGPGILILHAWWGFNEFFRMLCERFAQEGFVVFAPDLYHGRGPVQTIEQAEEIMPTLHQDEAFADITAAVSYLLAQPQTSRSSVGVVGFSLGGAYALDMSVTLAEEIAAIVTFYATYPGLDYRRAKAAYLCHFAEDDPFEPAESVTQMEQDLQATGRMVTVSMYPGTKHWFFEEDRPEYDAQAARLAWGQTIEFLHQQLD